MSEAASTVPRMYHPSRHLHSLGQGVTMSVEPTPGNLPAWWCPASDHITLRPDLKQVERRCHLAHELAHRDLEHVGECHWGDGARQTGRQERDADELAARRLIHLDSFIEALCWSDEAEQIAEALWVTRHMLDVRVRTMYGGERKRVAVELDRRL